MAGLADFRAQHPEYNDLSDVDLTTALHKKYYSDIPRGDFFDKMGVTPGPGGSTTGKPSPKRATGLPAGMLEPGTHTPNEPGFDGGSVSFEFSEGGTPKEVVVPNVVNGRKLTNDEAIARYKKTGEHFGKFDTPANADAFASSFQAERPVAETSPMATQKVDAPERTLLGGLTAAAEGAGQGAFNVGGIVGSRIDPNYEANRAARAEQYPLESGAGYLAGAGAAGGAAGRAIAAVPGLAPVAGQGVRNVLRLAGEGAATGGAQAAAEGQDPTTGAAIGAVAGPATAGLVKGTIGAARGIGGLVDQSIAGNNAIRALAKRVGSSPQELVQAMTAFRTATGRAPTLTEVVDAGSAEELGRVADARISAANQFRASAEQITAQRPNRMQAQIAAGGPTDNVARLRDAQNTAMNARMAQIETRPVLVPNADVQRFLDPDAVRVLNHDLRARLSQAAISGRPAQLTVRDVDNMRQAFDAAAGTGQRYVFGNLADRVTAIGSRQVPSYGSALNEFSGFERNIKGFQNGIAAKTPGELTNTGDIADARTQDYRAGRNVGVRTRLAEQAGASEQKAISTADALRQNAGLADETRGALGTRETALLQQLGAAETQSADRLAQVTRAPKAPSEERAQDIQAGIERVVAVGGHALTGFRAHVAAKLTQLSVGSMTAQRLAEAATDPARLPDVIAALRRANLTEQQIRGVLLPTLSGGAGAAAGGTQ